MRRTFVVLALLAMMIGLDALKTKTQGATDPLTLAAIGFVVLAAFALAELGSKLQLPKVTGYILSGVALGPFAVDILSRSVVNELRMFSTLALGLIALTAGLELNLRGLGRLAKTLAVTTGIKIAFGFSFVSGTLLVLATGTGWLGELSDSQALTLALVFGALSIGTSPSIAVAVTTETGSKGRLTELVLGAAVVKDVVVVICLAVSLAAGEAFMGGGQVGVEVLFNLGKELGASMFAGAVVGAVLIAYLRWIGHEMLLVVLVVVLVVAEVSAALHLELLLVFIAAGATVRNASPYEHDLLDPLQMISLPVFIVFFTNAGASVDLQASWRLLPVALSLCVVRAIGYYGAAWAGAKIGREEPAVKRLAWLAYLPQAGVTLGLVGVASRALPELQEAIASLGMAVVAVNLLVGPITLRTALQGAGEIPNDASPKPESKRAAQSTAEPVELESPRLRKSVAQVEDSLNTTWQLWRQSHLLPELRAWREALRAEIPDDQHQATPEVGQRLDRVPQLDAPARAEALRAVLLQQLAVMEALPAGLEVPLEERHRKPRRGDSASTRVIKRLFEVGAFFTGRLRTRTRLVPVRMAARTVVEPAMARLAEESLRDLQRFEVNCLETMQRVALGSCTWSEGQAELDGLVETFTRKVEENHRVAGENAIRELARVLGRVGAPAEWRNPIRYSRVATSVTDALRRLQTDSNAWTERRSAAVRTLRFVTEVEHAEQRLAADLRRDVADPLDEAFAALARLVDDQRDRISALPRAGDVKDDEAWTRLGVRVRATLPKPAQRELRSLTARVRRATSASAPLSGALSFVSDGEATIKIVPSLHELARAPRPARVDAVTVDVRELKEVQISGQLLPDIERILDEASQSLAAIREGMREAASLVEFGFNVADTGRKTGKPDAAAKFDESLERAAAMLTTLRLGACASWSRQSEHLMMDVSQMSNRLFQALIAAGGGVTGARVRSESVSRLRSRAGGLVEMLQARLRRVIEILRSGDAAQAADDLAIRYRLRTGDRRVDAQAIRSYLEDQLKARSPNIAGLYASLFTADPLRDPRLFVANREALSAVVKAARTWQADPKTGNGALVLGGSGSGKSSTLGIAQLKLGARRVILIRRKTTDEGPLFEALARALGCEPDREAVARSLRSQRTVVVLDDLHHWLPPSVDALSSVRAVQWLMNVTERHTFFLVAMNLQAFEVWQRVVPLQQSFGCVVRLRGVGPEALDAVIAARHELSGQPIDFPTTWAASIAQRLLGRPIRASYVRNLATISGGNLRRALALWLSHARQGEDGIHLQPLHTFGWALPFVHQLGPTAMGTLAILLRHGPQPESVLGACLGVPDEDLGQTARFLVAAGLLLRDETSDQLTVNATFTDDLVRALAEHGAVAGDKP